MLQCPGSLVYAASKVRWPMAKPAMSSLPTGASNTPCKCRAATNTRCVHPQRMSTCATMQLIMLHWRCPLRGCRPRMLAIGESRHRPGAHAPPCTTQPGRTTQSRAYPSALPFRRLAHGCMQQHCCTGRVCGGWGWGWGIQWRTGGTGQHLPLRRPGEFPGSPDATRADERGCPRLLPRLASFDQSSSMRCALF